MPHTKPAPTPNFKRICLGALRPNAEPQGGPIHFGLGALGFPRDEDAELWEYAQWEP